MAFLYSLTLKLLYPTSLALVFLVSAGVCWRRRAVHHVLLVLALGALVVPGNGWLGAFLVGNLEEEHPAPDPMPTADAIVVLGGGTTAAIAPRSAVEVGEAGDRVLHAARLFRQGKAPRVICTSGVATGGVAPRPPAEDMAELIEFFGVPPDAIAKETASGNTREHARNLAPMLQERRIRRVLLVTSAMHMPRSLGVFRKACPEIEFIPAPTDYRITVGIPRPWYHELRNLIPTPSSLQLFSEAAHEYLGMTYYRMRRWME